MTIKFREILTEDAKIILDWRTSKRVSKNLITDVEYNIENQKKWIESCYYKKNFYHWIIEFNNTPIGYLSITDFSSETKDVSFGVFIGDEKYVNFGGIALFYFYNFVFNKLNKEEINIEVFYFNIKTIELHIHCGYEFSPKHDKTVIKNSKKQLLISLKLTKKRWLENKKYHKFICDFPMNLRNTKQ